MFKLFGRTFGRPKPVIDGSPVLVEQSQVVPVFCGGCKKDVTACCYRKYADGSICCIDCGDKVT